MKPTLPLLKVVSQNKPIYYVKAILKLRDRIKQKLVNDGWLGISLTGVSQASFLYTALEDFQPTEETLSAAFSVISDKLDFPLTHSMLSDIALILAVKYEDLVKGQLYKPWNPATNSKVWGLFHIEDIHRIINDKPRYQAIVKTYAGQAVGKSFNYMFSASFVKVLLKECSGSWDLGKYPEDLCGMWFTGILDFSGMKLKLDGIFAADCQKNLNKELLKARQDKCIHGFIEGNCCLCPVGLDKCRIARHKNTYIYGDCRGTVKRHKGFIESNGYCQTCMHTGAFERNDKRRTR